MNQAKLRIICVGCLLVLLMPTSTLISVKFERVNKSMQIENEFLKHPLETHPDKIVWISQLVAHSAIVINNDSHFSYLVGIEGWDGDGSVGTPYIIEDLRIVDSSFGIYINRVTSHFIIRNCMFSGVSLLGTGIIVDSSPNGVISDCAFENGENGIHGLYSEGLEIESCEINFMSENGIYLQCVNNSIIKDTIVHDCGTGIADHGNKNEHDLEITGCTIFDNDGYGIDVVETGTSVIENNLIHNNGFAGICLNECPCSEVVGNTVYENGAGEYRGAGAYIRDSPSTIVSQNNFSLNYEEGITLKTSPNTIIQGNDLIANGWGFLSGSSENCSILSNKIKDNIETGIGIQDCPNTEILSNEVIGNGKTGIDVTTSDDSNIISNLVYDNSRYGLDLDGSQNCKIVGNEIGWNLECNALQSHSSGSTWFSPVGIGNAWSDYSGSGNYPIPGESGFADEYPIALLLIEQTPSIVFIEEDNNLTIEWETQGLYPHSYELRLDGTKIQEGVWAGENITFSQVNMGSGNHNVTLSIKDTMEHYVSHSVMYEVPLSGTFLVMFVVIIATGGMLSALILFRWYTAKSK